VAAPDVILLASFVPGWDTFVGFIKVGLDWLANLTGSAGLAIILFTIFIKLLVTPLTIKALRSGRAMQELQPKIRALQKRYGNDRQKISAETMRLYQEHKVNPMAGCFPMLVQIPVFIGLYQAIYGLSQQGTGEFAQPFLWMPSLAAPDHLHILPFVAAIFQLIQTRMSLPTGKYKTDDPQQKMMNQMMQFMPIMVIFFGWSFAAGPVIYWATQSIFSAVQQYFITGWGSLREWLPFLPEVTRYTPPLPDAIEEDKVIVTGSDEGSRPAPTGGGLWGLLNRQIQKVEEQRQATAPSGDGDGKSPNRADRGRSTGGARVAVSRTNAGERTGKAGQGIAASGSRNGAEAEDDAATAEPSRGGRSRIAVTNTAKAKANTAPGGASGPAGPADAPDATENGEPRGPAVPRKNRSRR
jgi:YidC/Oxa1 family membrane protein insertase